MERIKVQVGPKIKRYAYQTLNITDVLEHIKLKNLPADIEKELINIAQSFPHGALPQLIKDLDIHVQRIIENASKNKTSQS